MRYAQLFTEARRLEILRALEQDTDYELNLSLLQRALGMVGLKVSGDQIHSDVAWLEEQGLLTTRDVSGLLLAKLTGRGLDVAQGCCLIPGVARPRPEA